jgi:hypothetical protein
MTKEDSPMSEVQDKYRGSREYLLVYCELIRAARYRGTTTYQAVAEIVGLPLTGSYMGKEIGQLLGEIVEDESRQGRPMLTAVVVSSASSLPGSGFFNLARELGKLQGGSPEAERGFWEEEKEAVYATWQREFRP